MEARVLWTVVVALVAVWLVLLRAHASMEHVMMLMAIICVTLIGAVIASGAEAH